MVTQTQRTVVNIQTQSQTHTHTHAQGRMLSTIFISVAVSEQVNGDILIRNLRGGENRSVKPLVVALQHALEFSLRLINPRLHYGIKTAGYILDLSQAGLFSILYDL